MNLKESEIITHDVISDKKSKSKPNMTRYHFDNCKYKSV